MAESSILSAGNGRRLAKFFFLVAVFCGLVALGKIYHGRSRSHSQTELLAGLASPSIKMDLESAWSSRRGRAPAVLGERDSFRLGVWVLELQLAAKRQDEKTVELKLGHIRRTLASTQAPDLHVLVEAIDGESRERCEQVEQLNQLLIESTWLIDTSQYGLGWWSRTAWQVVESGREDLIDDLLEEKNFAALTGEARTTQKALRAEMREKRFAEAKEHLRRLLEESGPSVSTAG